ncbi:hypothetical protein AYI68_g6624 [Smittium mucronatum]|uniref:Uncharacterized protein n=1 Tax=Smittium mucronatum TaxID=133383 RepID=A0A1R0GQY9_9FUNG|nr:hypothetical protein AYI68_g6624 [Smittium mucronatum]
MNRLNNEHKISITLDEPTVLLRGSSDESSGVILGGYLSLTNTNKKKSVYDTKYPKSITIELINKQFHCWEFHNDTGKAYKKICKHVVKKVILENLDRYEADNFNCSSYGNVKNCSSSTIRYEQQPQNFSLDTETKNGFAFSIPIEGNITESISHPNYTNMYYLKATVVMESKDHIPSIGNSETLVSKPIKSNTCSSDETVTLSPDSKLPDTQFDHSLKSKGSHISSLLFSSEQKAGEKSRFSKLLNRSSVITCKHLVTISRDILVDGHLYSSGGIEIEKVWLDALNIKITSSSNVYHPDSEIESIIQFVPKIPGIALYSIGVSLWETSKFFQISRDGGPSLESKRYNKVVKSITKSFTPLPKYNQIEKPVKFLGSMYPYNGYDRQYINRLMNSNMNNTRSKSPKRTSIFNKNPLSNFANQVKHGFLTMLPSFGSKSCNKNQDKLKRRNEDDSNDHIVRQLWGKPTLSSLKSGPTITFLQPHQKVSDVITLKIPPNNTCSNVSCNKRVNLAIPQRFDIGANTCRCVASENDFSGRLSVKDNDLNCDSVSNEIKISHRLRYSISLTDGIGHQNYIWISSPVYIVPNRDDHPLGKTDDLPLYRYSYRDYMIQKRSHANIVAPSYE